MHFQEAPAIEAKLVRCTGGAIFDVVLDLRPGSASYGEWYGVELSAENGRMLYVPEHCAHGYQTLEDCTEMYYMTSGFTPRVQCGAYASTILSSAFDGRWTDGFARGVWTCGGCRNWDIFSAWSGSDLYTAIDLVFRKFTELATARRLHFRLCNQQIKLPATKKRADNCLEVAALY